MIYLVRHGQTDWNLMKKIQGHTDLKLNDTGRKQAEQLALEIKNFNLDIIITSDLIRAKETTDILNRKQKINVLIEPRLKELNLGRLEGQPLHRLTPEAWQELSKENNIYQAETLKDAFLRVRDFFEQLNKNQNVLIVTHSGLLKLIAYYRFYPDYFDYAIFSGRFRDLWLPNTQIFEWDRLGA